MAYTKKNRRKKRKPIQNYEAPMTDEEKAKIQYKDEFQKTWGSRVEDFFSKFDGKGKQILYALAGFGVLLVLLGIFYIYQRRQGNIAQAALGSAIETSQAQVTDTPQTAGDTRKIFKTEKERAEASIKEFEEVANKFGGEFASKAKYFIAVNRLSIDREAGIQELESLTGTSGEVGYLSKFALAQVKAEDDKFDEAAKLYQDLAAVDNPTIAKDTINFELASVFEKQDKTDEAVEIYFNITKSATDAKDSEGKAIPLAGTAIKARSKLEELAPEKAKEIKPADAPDAQQLPLG